MVPPASHRVSRVPWYSGYCSLASDFAYRAFTLSGRLSQSRSARTSGSRSRSEPQGARALVWALPVPLAATPGITFVFSSSGYLDVSVRQVPLRALSIGARMAEVLSAGFPHSDTPGSLGICSSPGLFAAYHVFHRLSVPRHPPYALIRMANLQGPGHGSALPRLHMHSVACVGSGQFLYRLSSSDVLGTIAPSRWPPRMSC